MDELSQILNCEEKNKNRIKEVKESAEKEIKEKEKEISEKLSLMAGFINDVEKEKVLKNKKEKIKNIEQEIERDFDLKKNYIKNKKEKHEKSAVDYIVDDFLNN